MAKKKDDDQLSIEGTEEMEILARLNERVEKAVDLIQKLRKENESLKAKLEENEKDASAAAASRKKAEEEAAMLKARLEEVAGESGERLEEVEGELEKLKEERQTIRKRVESVLERLESLEA